MKKRTKKLLDLAGVRKTSSHTAFLLWSFVWPFPAMLGLVVLCLVLCRVSGLLLITSLFWAPVVLLLASAAICARNPIRIVSIIAAGCMVWQYFPTFKAAAIIVHIGVDTPFLITRIFGSGIPPGHRLLVIRDWSGGFAGSPFQFLVYDDTGQLSHVDENSAERIPPYFGRDETARLCVGRSEPLLWRFYLCTI